MMFGKKKDAVCFGGSGNIRVVLTGGLLFLQVETALGWKFLDGIDGLEDSPENRKYIVGRAQGLDDTRKKREPIIIWQSGMNHYKGQV